MVGIFRPTRQSKSFYLRTDWSHRMSNRLLQGLIATFMAAIGVLTVAAAVIDWGEVDIVLNPSRITSERDHAYLVDVSTARPFFAYRSDTPSRPDQSDLVLLEDGNRLGPAHALHQLIRDEGRGSYSHWRGTLHFSASDNSDPRSNGRTYEVHVPLVLAPTVIYGVIALDGAVVIALLVLGRLRGWRLEDVRIAGKRASSWLTERSGPLSRLVDRLGIRHASTARRAPRLIFVVVVTLLAAIVNLVMLRYTDFRPCLSPDSGSYLAFSLIRTRGYTAAVLAVHALTGDIRWMVPLQLNLLLLSLTMLGYSVGRLAENLWLGILLTVACAATVPLLLLTYHILTEATFMAFVALHCGFVANYLRTRRWPHAVAAGTMLVIAILIRPAGYSLLLGIPLVTWLVNTNRFRSMLALGTPVAAGLMLASVANYTQFGVFNTQSFGGYSILGHTLFLLDPEDGVHTDIAPLIRDVATDIAPIAKPVRDLPFPREAWNETANVYNQLLWGRTVPKLATLLGQSTAGPRGVELEKQINDLGLRIALITIRAHPYEYARHVLANYYGMWSGLLLNYGSPGAYVAPCYAATRAILEVPGNKIFTRFMDPAYFFDSQTSARVQARAGDRHWLQKVYQGILDLRPMLLTAGFVFSLWFSGIGLTRTTTILTSFACYLSVQLNGYFFFVASVQAALERYAVPLTPILYAIILLGTTAAFRSVAGALTARRMARRLTAREGYTRVENQ